MPANNTTPEIGLGTRSLPPKLLKLSFGGDRHKQRQTRKTLRKARSQKYSDLFPTSAVVAVPVGRPMPVPRMRLVFKSATLQALVAKSPEKVRRLRAARDLGAKLGVDWARVEKSVGPVHLEGGTGSSHKGSHQFPGAKIASPASAPTPPQQLAPTDHGPLPSDNAQLRPGESLWLRSGYIPKSGKSRHRQYGEELPGVSVWQELGKPYAWSEQMLFTATAGDVDKGNLHVVAGTQIGEGHDGEPIISGARMIRPATQMERHRLYDSAHRTAVRQFGMDEIPNFLELLDAEKPEGVGKSLRLVLSKAQPMNALPGRQHLVLRPTHDKFGRTVKRWMRPEGPMGGVAHTGHWLSVRGHRVFVSSQQPRIIAAVESESRSGHLVGKKLSAGDWARFLENTKQRPRRAPRTPDEKLSGDRKKFARVREFNDDLPKFQRTLDAGLRLGDMAADRVKAAVITLMLKAHLRIGNEDSADFGVAGATTLLPENVTVTGNTVRLSFTGKSGVPWDRKVTDKALAASVAEALRNAEPGQPLFRKRGPGSASSLFNPQGQPGKLVPLTDREIRNDLAEHGIQPKDLRTWAASVIAFREFRKQGAKHGEELPAREVSRRANAVFAVVAEELGHTPAMAKNAYVSPALTRWFVEHGGRMTLSKPRFAVAETKTRVRKAGFGSDIRKAVSVSDDLITDKAGVKGHWRFVHGHAIFIPQEGALPEGAHSIPQIKVGSWKDGSGLSVRFDYDPNIVAKVKTIAGRQWLPGSKAWSIPFSSFKMLCEAFPDVAVKASVITALDEAEAVETKRVQEAAAETAALSSEEREFKPDVLLVPEDTLDRCSTFNFWLKGFLRSNHGKSRQRLSAKQLSIVDEAQGKLESWLKSNPSERKVLLNAYQTENASKVAAAAEKQAIATAVLESQEAAAEDFTFPNQPNLSVLSGGDLFDHQKKGVLWLQKVKRGILAFATALGKTYTATTAAVALQEAGKAKRALFVVPSARKVGTVRDINSLYPDKKVVLIDGTPSQRAKQYEDARDADFVVAGYALIQREPEKLKGEGFDIVVNDECVRLKGKSSQVALNAKEHFSAPYIWDLSATPIPNSPEDLYNLMARLQPALLGTRTNFMNEHCTIEWQTIPGGRKVPKITGYKDKKKTREVVAPYIMSRTWESPDVNVPMTQKSKVVQTLDMAPDQRKLYELAREGALQVVAGSATAGQLSADEKSSVLTSLLRMEQLGITPEILDPDYKGKAPKIDEAVQIVHDHFYNGENHGIALYCHFLPVLDILHRELLEKGTPDNEIAVIRGGMKATDVQSIVDGMNSGKYKILLASDAAAEGLNLQGNANKLLHLDIPWRPDVLEQREGRIYRPGQTSDVVLIRLAMDNDVETHKAEVVARKAQAQRAIVEGVESDESPELTYDDYLKLLGTTRDEITRLRKKTVKKASEGGEA